MRFYVLRAVSSRFDGYKQRKQYGFEVLLHTEMVEYIYVYIFRFNDMRTESIAHASEHAASCANLKVMCGIIIFVGCCASSTDENDSQGARYPETRLEWSICV